MSRISVAPVVGGCITALPVSIRTRAKKELDKLVLQTGATDLYYAKRYEPLARRQEADVDSRLQARLDIHAFDDSLLNHPEHVMTGGGTPYRVFTPFWKSSVAAGDPPVPEPVPGKIGFASHSLDS